MNKSNYQIHYYPIIKSHGNLRVDVSNEFVEFAKKQKINKEKYEELGLSFIKLSGWPDYTKEMIRHGPSGGRICNWWEENDVETGLLFFVNVPGNAAGLCLEDGADGWRYYPHNMDNMSQAAVALGIITEYLSEIELNI